MRLLTATTALLLAIPVSAAEPKATIEVPEGLVLVLAYSPDGKILASGGSPCGAKNCPVHLWDTKTNKQLKTLKATGVPISSMQFSPDGNTLLTGGTPHLWDLKTDKAIILKGHQTDVDSVSFSSDGKTVATSDPTGSIRIWNAQTGKEQARIGDGSGCAVYTPDGKTLIYGTGIRGGVIKLWDVAPVKERAAIKAESDQVNRLACSNETIAYYSLRGMETTIHLLDFKGKELSRMKGHKGFLMAMAFSPDGKLLATGCSDRTIGVWDVDSGKQLTSFPGWAETVAFSPDGKTLATGTGERAIQLWDVPELRTEKK